MGAKLFGIPHVLSIHDGDIFDPSKKLSLHKTRGLHYVVQTVMNCSYKILAQSVNTQANAQAYYRLSRAVEIIPHAIQRPVFQTRQRADFHLAPDDFLLSLLVALFRAKPCICSLA